WQTGMAVSHNSAVVNYSWIDMHTGNTKNYYRIKTVNKDGSYGLSKIVSVLVAPAKINVSCFPNPVASNGNMHVNITVLQPQPARVIIFTISGQHQREIPVTLLAGTQSCSFCINNLSSGTYLLGVMDQNGAYVEPAQQIVVK